ncbi:unnamed protein product, partial [marine sediment metagenome]
IRINHSMETALMIVPRFKCIKTVELLLSYGADPNIQNINGQTALMLANMFSCTDNVIDMLLKYGAYVDIVDYGGRSVFNIIELMPYFLFHSVHGHVIKKKRIKKLLAHMDTDENKRLLSMIKDNNVQKKFLYMFTAL